MIQKTKGKDVMPKNYNPALLPGRYMGFIPNQANPLYGNTLAIMQDQPKINSKAKLRKAKLRKGKKREVRTKRETINE